MAPIGDGDRGRLRDLDEDACRELLARHRIGRLAWNDGDGPVILPVSYAFDEEHVLVRTSPHTELARHFTPGQVAFEIDEYDEHGHAGWSVLVRGHAQVADWNERPSPAASPTPVVAGERNFHIRIAVERVTGRRILPA
jgi:nitroimidazol reductase NimA-like FMN-containing flavoprotein (pyridoxamine 5'-phosphate oxidase superfamily)